MKSLTVSSILLMGLVFLLPFHVSASPNSAGIVREGTSEQQLVLLNWSDYIDPDLVEKFETEFHAKVKHVYFNSDEDRDRLYTETDGIGFDVVLVDDATLREYVGLRWISPIDLTKLPNYQHLDPKWCVKHDGQVFAIPYHWGTLGIAYREDLISEPITRWADFYKPKDEIKGKIALTDDSWDIVGLALKTLGFSARSDVPSELAAAEELLRAQKPFVKRYSTNYTLSEESALVKGEILAAMMYNGDALTIQELNSDITYVVPDEGGILWLDNLCISTRSRQKQLAHAFINFMTEPTNAAQNAQSLYYATPNAAALKLLPKEFLEDAGVFPTPDILTKCESYIPISARGIKARNAIVSRLNVFAR